jgi:outer membrane protein assembly factor BamB
VVTTIEPDHLDIYGSTERLVETFGRFLGQVPSDGRIIGCADNNIYAVDARSARESWRFATEHQVTGSPVVYEDSVYVGSVDGSLYCIDMRSGRKRWQFSTAGPITGTPLIANGIVYIGSTDHKVYALLA